MEFELVEWYAGKRRTQSIRVRIIPATREMESKGNWDGLAVGRGVVGVAGVAWVRAHPTTKFLSFFSTAFVTENFRRKFCCNLRRKNSVTNSVAPCNGKFPLQILLQLGTEKFRHKSVAICDGYGDKNICDERICDGFKIPSQNLLRRILRRNWRNLQRKNSVAN